MIKQMWKYYKKLYESCDSNSNFLETINKFPDRVLEMDESLIKQGLNNKDLLIKEYESGKEELYSLFLKNELRTIRLGNIESRFLIKQVFNKDIMGDFEKLKDKNDDFRMRSNAGLYYNEVCDSKNVHKWWCDNTLDFIKNQNTTLTSCFLFLYSDLYLFSLLDIKKSIINFGSSANLITLFESKKVLVVSNGAESMKKSFDMGLQRAYKQKIPNFKLYCLESPQTTIGMPYPHKNSIETTNFILDEIDQKYGDFDVALLACGCYGPPLSNLLAKKHTNKNIIYMGSMLYTMFGLYSNGIQKTVFNTKLFNTDGFIEVPQKCPEVCKKIENGKYWS
jgi:hypothetical protein